MAAIFLDCQIGVLACQCMPLRIADQNLSQRTNLRRFTVEARSLHPGIFLFAVPAGEGGSVSPTHGCNGFSP